MEPVRILHVLDNLGQGGVQTFLLNYYRHIDRSKIQFDFFVRTGQGAHRQELLQYGARIFAWEEDSREKDLSSAFGIFLKNHPEYSIVHAHQNFQNAKILRVARKYHVPVRISHSHSNYPATSWQVKCKRALFHCGIGWYATHLWGCSQPALDWLYGNWNLFRRDKRIVHNAVPWPHCDMHHVGQIKTEYQLDEKFVVIHVGMFTAPKNHTFLLRVFQALQQRCSESALILVGDGILRETIQQTVQQLELKNVHFAGRQSAIYDYLSVADCFLFPSLFEGLSLAVIEAQALGIPCVVSEAVSQEALWSSHVTSRQLSDTTEDWAWSCWLAGQNKPTASRMDFSATGFDIEVASRFLQETYQKIIRDYLANA